MEEGQSKGDRFRHIGSIDIDWVIDPSKMEERQYSTIRKLLTYIGWSQTEGSSLTFEKMIPGDDRIERKITTDLLTVKLPSMGKNRRHRELQGDLNPNSADS